MPDVETLIALAADPDHTVHERAAALAVAARMARPSPSWPDPPPGWQWQGGELVRTAPSSLPPLRSRGTRCWPDPVEDEEPVAAVALPTPSPRPISVRTKRPDPSSGAGIVCELLGRPEGASLSDLVTASGLSATSVRGTVSLYLRHTVRFDKVSGRYVRVQAEAA